MYAALYGDCDAVRRVLAAGADVNAANDNGTTALSLAVHDANKTRVLLQPALNPISPPTTAARRSSSRLRASAALRS